MGNIIVKTLVLYFFIVLSYRVMGKKEVGKLGIVDLLVFILIGELAAISITEEGKPLWEALVPIILLVIIQISVSYLSLKSRKLRRFIDGTPSMIIEDGKVNFHEMVKLRYSLDDLIVQLRERGIKSIEEVRYAVLENNGKLSVFGQDKRYPMPIILDGVVDFQVLSKMKKDIHWLNHILEERKISLENVFYAFYSGDKTFIIEKKNTL